ncbi:MAG: helix-turn-helix transcriptional regulator [Rhizobiales bacterium]|nr:helix-turn-helix transcriptional regulator [Hyphomicrobiales bacterium]
MKLSVDEFSSMTTLMFAAALDQTKWIDFLNYLAKFVGVRTQMYGYDAEHHVGIGVVMSGYDPDFMDSYEKYYANINNWASGISKKAVGETISCEGLCTRSIMEKSEFYNDWILPQEDIIGGGGAILYKDNKRLFIIGSNIRRKDQHLEKDWLDLVHLLVPHLQNAIEINRLLFDQKVEQIGYNYSTSSETAIFIVNHRKDILFTNQTGDTMLSAQDVVTANTRHQLAFTENKANTTFKRIIHSLRHIDVNMSVSSKFTAENLTAKQDYFCRTARFDSRHQDVSPFGILINIHEPSILITVSKTNQQTTTASNLVITLNITLAEAEVALLLAQGLTPQEIALERGVSIHTVRNQLTSTMAKINVRRHVDLLRMIQ